MSRRARLRENPVETKPWRPLPEAMERAFDECTQRAAEIGLAPCTKAEHENARRGIIETPAEYLARVTKG